MSSNASVDEKLSETLFPIARPKIQAYREKRGRFAYYTDADTATKIISNKELWMRSTETMNDFDEVRHGQRMFFTCLQKTTEGQEFLSALDMFEGSFANDLLTVFGRLTTATAQGAFITCLSEHDDAEDQHGRLSMWRAYGSRNGVALVFKGERVLADGNYQLGAMSSPVEYLNEDGFRHALGKLAANLKSEMPMIKQAWNRAQFHQQMMKVLHAAVLCVKHPGFLEEREWRVFAVPHMFESELERAICTVRGTPQEILKIKLIDQPDKGIQGLDLAHLLDRVIIGPCDFPSVTARAFDTLLKSAGIKDPAPIIHVSGIPLRHF